MTSGPSRQSLVERIYPVDTPAKFSPQFLERMQPFLFSAVIFSSKGLVRCLAIYTWIYRVACLNYISTKEIGKKRGGSKTIPAVEAPEKFVNL